MSGAGTHFWSLGDILLGKGLQTARLRFNFSDGLLDGDAEFHQIPQVALHDASNLRFDRPFAPLSILQTRLHNLVKNVAPNESWCDLCRRPYEVLQQWFSTTLRCVRNRRGGDEDIWMVDQQVFPRGDLDRVNWAVDGRGGWQLKGPNDVHNVTC